MLKLIITGDIQVKTTTPPLITHGMAELRKYRHSNVGGIRIKWNLFMVAEILAELAQILWKVDSTTTNLGTYSPSNVALLIYT